MIAKARRIFFFLALGAITGFLGCGNGTDTGNPVLGIRFVGQPAAITVTEARIVLKEINLEPLEGCLVEEGPGPEAPELEFEFAGPFVIDLLNNTSVPDLGTVPIAAGTYCELELLFDKLEPATLPAGISPSDPIVDNALLVRGTREDGTAFIARLESDDRFKLEGTHPEGFEIREGLAEFFVSFDLGAWFEGVDLDSATVSDQGIILLDSQNNIGLWTAFIENVKLSSRLFRDLNSNGILDPAEQDPSLILGQGVDEPE